MGISAIAGFYRYARRQRAVTKSLFDDISTAPASTPNPKLPD
jgi:hypothetical protein